MVPQCVVIYQTQEGTVLLYDLIKLDRNNEIKLFNG